MTQAPAHSDSQPPVDAAWIDVAHATIRDLFAPTPAIYWADFGASLLVGYGAAAWHLSRPLVSVAGVASLFVAVCAVYRLSCFLHEAVHVRDRRLPGFRRTYDVLVGVPLLMPSFWYRHHRAHHAPRHYGTARDGEYLPLGRGSRRLLVGFFAQVLVQPIAVGLRFLVGTPVSWLHRGWRRRLIERHSALVINPRYERPAESRRNDRMPRWDAVIEAACAMRAWLLIGTWLAGWPLGQVPRLYFLATCVLTLNYLRTAAAHRFVLSGSASSLPEQVADSVTITGHPLLTELLCPLGLRYHALHHLFPALPYHQLGHAHRRLVAKLPPDCPYHATLFPSFGSVLRELVRRKDGERSERSVRCEERSSADTSRSRRATERTAR